MTAILMLYISCLFFFFFCFVLFFFSVPAAEFEPYNQANRMIIAYVFFVWRWISFESAFENEFFQYTATCNICMLMKTHGRNEKHQRSLIYI